MDWPTIVTIVLGSSVLGSLLTSLVGGFFQTRERKRYNSYIALTLSHLFENYALGCLDTINDDENYQSSNGHIGHQNTTPPRSFDLPKENFRDFDLYLLDSIFEFPQKVAFAKAEVIFLHSVTEDEEAHGTFYKNTVELADHALSLAKDIRTKYNLPQRKLSYGKFEFPEELKMKRTQYCG